MPVLLTNIVKNPKTDGVCRVKIQRPLTAKPTPTPSLLLYSKDGMIPPTMIRDMQVFRAMDGRRKVYFVCKIEGSNLVLVQESAHDNW